MYLIEAYVSMNRTGSEMLFKTRSATKRHLFTVAPTFAADSEFANELPPGAGNYVSLVLDITVLVAILVSMFVYRPEKVYVR